MKKREAVLNISESTSFVTVEFCGADRVGIRGYAEEAKLRNKSAAFVQNNKGMMTVFLSLILLSLLVITGVLADGARILMAENKVEIALGSACRSALASYHSGLMGEYGLTGTPDLPDKIADYFRLNMTDPASEEGVGQYEIRDIRVWEEEAESLLNNAQYKEQVMAYMELKGPLLVGESIISMVSPEKMKKNAEAMLAGAQSLEVNQGPAGSSLPKETQAASYGDVLGKLQKIVSLRTLEEEDLISETDFRLANPERNVSWDPERLTAWLTPAEISWPEGEGASGAETDIGIETDEGGSAIAGFIQIPESISFMAWSFTVPTSLAPEAASLPREENSETKAPALTGAEVGAFVLELARGLKDVAQQGQERLYLVEYLMDRFTYVTSPTVREHVFTRGEVEYILCGRRTEGGNILEALARIWFLRYALDTLDAFVHSPVPEPEARLVEALAAGVPQAFRDVRQLYDGGKIPLFPSLKGHGLGYSDHLRLLLLVADEDILLDRSRQLIQANLKNGREDGRGFSLQACGTKCHAVVEVGLNLWFLPLLPLESLGLERFKEEQYLITREVALGYEGLH